MPLQPTLKLVWREGKRGLLHTLIVRDGADAPPPAKRGPRRLIRYFRLGLTAPLSVAPAVNLGDLEAFIFTACPVCGLRPRPGSPLGDRPLPKARDRDLIALFERLGHGITVLTSESGRRKRGLA